MTEVAIDGFTDIHFDIEDPSNGVVFPQRMTIKDIHNPMISALVETLSTDIKKLAKDGDERFAVQVGSESWRLQRITGTRYAARRITFRYVDVESLGLRNNFTDILLSEKLCSGGIALICGLPGQGKSTTMAAMAASRLKKFGGYCLTVEDPPEFRIEGFHGTGYCEQIDADGESIKKLSDTLRCFPANTNCILVYGEVRSAEEASMVIKIALAGHLVLTTIHGSSPVNGLKRLLDLAMMDDPTSSVTLSSVFKFSMFQRLVGKSVVNSVLMNEAKVEGAIMSARIVGLDDLVRPPSI